MNPATTARLPIPSTPKPFSHTDKPNFAPTLAHSMTPSPIVVHLRATGDAPILKQAKFKILGTDKFAKVIDFLRRQLHRDTLFVYLNSAFSPKPDDLVIDLYDNFGFDGKLVVNYAYSMAWG
ncbi:hypothetical protein J1N35_025528 [Gossypium stocksii]|uniref:Ubiquitin-like protein ATG12 n=1 Tax=Gossypium stocksii TaxID=47602 RepID=A0A9D3ZWA5_9ROSI|nr:hypothetical protein J1N35_025528 [Gossypium stocksii]